MTLSPEDWRIFSVMMRQGSLALGLCRLAAEGSWTRCTDVSSLCRAMGMPTTQRNALNGLLRDLEYLGLVERRDHCWQAAAGVDFARWGSRLEGGLTFKAHYSAENSVEIVLSRPPAPSEFITQLMQSLRADLGLLDTEQILPAIAETARERAVIVSPFIDDYGMERVLNFFRVTPAPDKRLIYRDDKDGVTRALVGVQSELRELGVQAHRYLLPLPEVGNESFHAKIVLADHHTALVGSSNMTKWSMTYSLELGVKVRGQAASRVAEVIDAMLACR